MAIFHCQVKNITRSSGRSSVAAAAYRSGTDLTNANDGVRHNYTKKGGVIHSEITIPDHAPAWAKDRSKLWNEVEKIEKTKDARTAKEFELALPNELNKEQQINLTREFAEYLSNQGMVADWNMHDKHDNKKNKDQKEFEIKVDDNYRPIDNENNSEKNIHVHMMTTTRPFNQDGTWGQKSRKEYILDADGKKIKVPNKKNPIGRPTILAKCVETTDWNNDGKIEEWRASWAKIVNKHLEMAGSKERIDHRSNAERGLEELPTIHLGTSATAMERRGEYSELGDRNREIKKYNQELANFNTEKELLTNEQITVEATEQNKQTDLEMERAAYNERKNKFESQREPKQGLSVERQAWFKEKAELKKLDWEISKKENQETNQSNVIKQPSHDNLNIDIKKTNPVTPTQQTFVPVDPVRYERNKKLQENIDNQCRTTGKKPDATERLYIYYAKIGLDDKQVAANMMIRHCIDNKTTAKIIAKYSPDKPDISDKARDYANNITKQVTAISKNAGGTAVMAMGGGGGRSSSNIDRTTARDRSSILERFMDPCVVALIARCDDHKEYDWEAMTAEQIETAMHQIANERD